MQEVKQQVEILRSKKQLVSQQQLVNVIRETLQVLTIKFIFQSSYGRSLSFMGGTCLRLCYDLKRYSEDLDFSLDGDRKTYSFKKLCETVKREFLLRNYSVELNISDDKIVQKSFVKFTGILQAFGLSPNKNQKLFIKIEVDTKPPSITPNEREDFFIHRQGEIFPVLKHALPILFAGKVLAILMRPYDRGRDYYDLIWYLSKRTQLDLTHVNKGLRQQNKWAKSFDTPNDVMNAIREKIKRLKPNLILKDIGPFLEDASELEWVKRYENVFLQLSEEWMQPFTKA